MHAAVLSTYVDVRRAAGVHVITGALYPSLRTTKQYMQCSQIMGSTCEREVWSVVWIEPRSRKPMCCEVEPPS
jgi:hypothetical protein